MAIDSAWASACRTGFSGGGAISAKLASDRRIHGLYAITSASDAGDELLHRVEQALRGGVNVLQYRCKSCSSNRLRREAELLVALCRSFRVPFIVNDHVALARAVGADGVHLGREDADLANARATLGPQAVVGVSCYDSLDRAQRAQEANADYVAFGSFFPSRTKPHATRADVTLLQTARALLHIPIVAIGGITPENGRQLLEAGADALAVIEGVFGEPEPESAARRYADLFRRADAQG